MKGGDGKTYVIKEVGSEGKKYKRWSVVASSELITVIKDGDHFTNVIVKDVEEPSVVSETAEKKASVRKAPSEPAKNYNEGYEMTSASDGKIYVVKTVGSDEKQFKRWVLKK